MNNQELMTNGISGSDDYQTPAYAVESLLKYINNLRSIWEPACGKGNIVNFFTSHGYKCRGTDISLGVNFYNSYPQFVFDCIITNPPYSGKNKELFLERCYEIGKPFALLMPISALGGIRRQNMYRKHGLQIIMLGRRVNFETPSGEGSGAWFETAWFTWGLNLPNDIMFEEMKTY